MYELCLLYKGLEFVISCDTIHPNNTTNIKGKSTRDIVTLMINDVKTQWNNQIPTYAIFSDISQDFPSVKYEILIQRMYMYYGFPKKYIQIMYDLFINCWCSVTVNGIRSKWFLQLIGLGQGRPLSPFLNMLYLDPLYYIIPDYLPLKLYIYVDDLVMWTVIKAIFLYDIQYGLQYAINNVIHWLKLNGMTLSDKKTKYIVFYTNNMKKHRTIPIPHLQINNIIKTKPENYVKYVGYYLTFNLSPKTQINYLVRRIYLDYKDILAVRKYTMNFPLDILIILTPFAHYETFIDIKLIRIWIGWLYMHDRNILSNLITDQWLPVWNNYLFSPINIRTGKNKLNYIKTHDRSNPLFKLFMLAHKHAVLPLINYTWRSNMNDNGIKIKFIPSTMTKPHNIQYINTLYTDTHQINNSNQTIFAFSDGSIIDECGGIGILLEVHELRNHSSDKSFAV